MYIHSEGHEGGTLVRYNFRFNKMTSEEILGNEDAKRLLRTKIVIQFAAFIGLIHFHLPLTTIASIIQRNLCEKGFFFPLELGDMIGMGKMKSVRFTMTHMVKNRQVDHRIVRISHESPSRTKSP